MDSQASRQENGTKCKVLKKHTKLKFNLFVSEDQDNIFISLSKDLKKKYIYILHFTKTEDPWAGGHNRYTTHTDGLLAGNWASTLEGFFLRRI